MKTRGKLIAWVAVLYALTLALPLAIGILLAIGLPDAEAATLRRVFEERAPALAFVAVLLLIACVAAVRWFFARYVASARALADQTRVIRSANAGLRLDGAGELNEVAKAINELAAAYGELQRDSDMRAAETRSRLEEERNRLAALMSELAQGVLVCNAEGTILLYNEAARTLFTPPDGRSAHPLVGLGRSVFALFDRGQIAHAAHKVERSLGRGERLPNTRFLASVSAGRLLKVQVAPFLDAESRLAGMVLTLEDVTGLLAREAQRRSLLQTFATRIRAPAANIRAAAENLASFPHLEPAKRSQFTDIIAAEAAALSVTINDALREYADALKAALTLEDMRATDLLEFARARITTTLGIEVEIHEARDELWLRVDSYAVVQAITHLAARVREARPVNHFELRARRTGRHAEIDLEWTGAIVASDALSLWESEPMQIGAEQSPLTVRDVLEQHGGEIWYRTGSVGGLRSGCFRFLVPCGEPAEPRPAGPIAASRPEYYDFDLFAHGTLAGSLHDARLTALTYTVFDTETTGLEPSAGDEIISIAAVRIVNNRLLRHEVFQQLVNPGRPLNPVSARVHRIDARTLAGQPSIVEVLPAFHRFCEDTVLVAHNAAFDMRFLELKQAATGLRFDHPVLDTLLLSAVAHPALQDHSLEAIAGRLGVDLIGRHTALGDALLASEIFLKLLPLLAEHGIVTLGQALEASRSTYYARLHY